MNLAKKSVCVCVDILQKSNGVRELEDQWELHLVKCEHYITSQRVVVQMNYTKKTLSM